jgi:hypothetical protein
MGAPQTEERTNNHYVRHHRDGCGTGLDAIQTEFGKIMANTFRPKSTT